MLPPILIRASFIATKLSYGVPKGVRTPVPAVKGRCPRPLDDGDLELKSYNFTTKYHSLILKWRPQGGSNPCSRRERAVS